MSIHTSAAGMQPPKTALKVAFATGIEPDKWFGRFADYRPHTVLSATDADDAVAEAVEGKVDVALARIPTQGADPRLDESFHVVRLYEEQAGVAVPKDSVFAELGEAVDASELVDEILNYKLADDGLVDVQAVRDGLQIVGANVGIVIAPRPLIKVLSKRQVVPLELNDSGVGEESPAAERALKAARTTIAVVWPKERDSDIIQDFVGICRGRSPQSSRGTTTKLKASEKAKARAERAGRGGRQPTTGGAGVKGKGGVRQPLSKRKKPSGRGKRR